MEKYNIPCSSLYTATTLIHQHGSKSGWWNYKKKKTMHIALWILRGHIRFFYRAKCSTLWWRRWWWWLWDTAACIISVREECMLESSLSLGDHCFSETRRIKGSILIPDSFSSSCCTSPQYRCKALWYPWSLRKNMSLYMSSIIFLPFIPPTFLLVFLQEELEHNRELRPCTNVCIMTHIWDLQVYVDEIGWGAGRRRRFT